MKKKHKFQRSTDANAEYYRKISVREKLKETVRLSDFCIKFGEIAKKNFHGK